MISILGSLSFVMSSAPAKKSAGGASCASQDPFIQTINVVPYNLDSNPYKECVLPDMSKTINTFNFFFQGVMKVRKRVTLTVITVSAIFGVCWLTDSISFILTFHIPTHKFGSTSYVTTATFIMINSAANPFVYALVNQRFREKLVRMMRGYFHPATNRIHPDMELQNMN